MGTKKRQSMDMAPAGDAPARIDPKVFYGMTLDDEQEVFANSIWDKEADIIFCNSRAGTGKTTVATGVANMLISYGMYNGIIYIMAPYGERKQGYLPGDLTEKSSVYFEAFYQALVTCGLNPHTAITNESLANQKNGTGFITCITDTFLRGTNLENAVVIIDEAQNMTASQLKTVLTRVGFNAKVIVIGHDLQCDLEDKSKSGFVRYMDHFRGQERARFCTLTHNHRSWISQFADELEEE